MAGEEAAESSRRRRTLMMPNSTGAAPEAPRTGEPKESLAPAVAGEPEKDDSCGCNSNFECNICLDVAKEPVVTPCGHLFRWPCLYRWLYAQSPFCKCPVCKGVVLKENITPICGRGSEEGESTANPDLPPRPRAHRRESLRQQLQMAGTEGNAREMARVLRQMIQDENQGWDATPARVQTTSVPAARQRAGARRQRRQDSNAAQVVLAAPQQSSSMKQLSTSSTATAIVGEPGPSSRSRRPSESPTIRRTRRRPQ